MKIKTVLAGLFGLSLAATAAIAGTQTPNITSARAGAYFMPGKHQFYVWCGNGKDYLAYQVGQSGADARAKLSHAGNDASGARCQPVWQGRVQF
jgi:hypothetical protein